jgi:hypothetical protein
MGKNGLKLVGKESCAYWLLVEQRAENRGRKQGLERGIYVAGVAHIN